MRTLRQFLANQRYWPAFAFIAAVIVLLPRLSSYGFWEPHEIRVADHARERLERADQQQEASEPKGKTKPTPKAKRPTGPPLTEAAVAWGFDTIGTNELGGRLPLAFLGLLAVMAAFFLGQRMGSARAGLLSALILLSMPLLLTQARHLNSDIGALTGSAIMMLGLVGVALPGGAERRATPSWLFAVDGILVGLGAILGYFGGGLVLGVFTPLIAFGIAGLLYTFTASSEHNGREKLHLFGTSAAAVIAGLVVFALAVVAIFDFIEPSVGDRAILGKALKPSKEYVDAIGGLWRSNGDLKVNFNTLFEQLAFGLFPWIALAPIAIGRLGSGRVSGRKRFGGYVLFSWALVSWFVASILARKVGPVHFPAVVAVAVAAALWIDDLLTSRAETAVDEGDEHKSSNGRLPRTMPVVALFVALAGGIVAKDMAGFPDKLTSLNLTGAVVKYPNELKLHYGILVIGGLFALALAGGIGLWRRHDLKTKRKGLARMLRSGLDCWGRYGVAVAVGLGLALSLFLAQVWTPALSTRLSSKNVFKIYRTLRAEGDRLAIVGNHGSGPTYYAGTEYEKLANRNELISFLQNEGRVFALTRASELCPLQKVSSTKEFEYHVLDDSNAQFLLLSNQLKNGETDQNPLSRSVLRQRPTNIQKPLDIDFDDKLQLIGVNMPQRVGRGDKFEMTLFFEVRKRIGKNWKIFVHFDGGGMRFQGDHDPIKGRCGTSYWQPGDYIVDTFEVEAGGLTYKKTAYRTWIGLFVGSAGNWTNMKVISGEHDENNRVAVGSVQVD